MHYLTNYNSLEIIAAPKIKLSMFQYLPERCSIGQVFRA
jgi:hypothetical protein